MLGHTKDSVSKPDGVIVIDGKEAADTVQCGHCGKHHKWNPRRAKKIGWCYRCNRWICATVACEPCVPEEKRLDLIEKGVPRRQVVLYAK